ncbi:hypothetical protein D3Z50_01265 [Clostridiaceae bacterium]|nr:hypothetical protein [Clostridiaceae bacterium]
MAPAALHPGLLACFWRQFISGETGGWTGLSDFVLNIPQSGTCRQRELFFKYAPGLSFVEICDGNRLFFCLEIYYKYKCLFTYK